MQEIYFINKRLGETLFI